jgi:hypothetical protein
LPQALPSAAQAFEHEWSLLLACATPQFQPEVISQCLAKNLDWDLLFRLGEDHNVLAVVGLRLQKLDFASVPADARDKFRARIRAQNLFALSMTAELFQILDDFAPARIEPILIKGPVLSLLAYRDSAVRTYADLDLIVRQRDILAASQHMRALGFEPDVPETAIRAGRVPGEYFFARPDTQRIIELHTEPTFRYYPRPMPIDDLYQRSRTVLLDGRPIRALSLEDELLLNCIHGAKHFWERLIWIADIASVVANQPEIDWHRAWQVAQAVGAERMLLVGLQLAADTLGIQVPAQMSAHVSHDPFVPRLSRQISGWLPMAGNASISLPARAIFRARMGGGGLTGALYLLRLSLSPTEEDWVEGSEARGFWLWDALRRPFRLIRKYGQGG